MSPQEPAPLHFEAPPLNEVVVGVQFAPSPSYGLVHAGEVWALFKERFPRVQEQPAIPPAFETFGAPQAPIISFAVNVGLAQTRFWFLTNSEAELVQFQPDRILHNWRKVKGQDHPYPRFENMILEFQEEVMRLDRYFAGLDGASLQINQCEVTYINQIRFIESMDSVRSWLNLFSLAEQPEDMSSAFRRVIRSSEGSPIGRLICETNTGVTADGQRVLLLQITARGAPASPSISSAIEFLKLGRLRIGQLFLEITTDAAHAVWERVK